MTLFLTAWRKNRRLLLQLSQRLREQARVRHSAVLLTDTLLCFSCCDHGNSGNQLSFEAPTSTASSFHIMHRYSQTQPTNTPCSLKYEAVKANQIVYLTVYLSSQISTTVVACLIQQGDAHHRGRNTVRWRLDHLGALLHHLLMR